MHALLIKSIFHLIGKHANSIALKHGLNFQRKLVTIQFAVRKAQERKVGLFAKLIVDVALNNEGRQADKIDAARVFNFDK